MEKSENKERGYSDFIAGEQNVGENENIVSDNLDVKSPKFLPRLFASIVDNLICTFIWLVGISILLFDLDVVMFHLPNRLGAFIAWLGIAPNNFQYIQEANEYSRNFLIIFCIVFIFYHFILEWASGKTVGFALVGAKIRSFDKNGHKVSNFILSFKREIILSLLILSLWWICNICNIPYAYMILFYYIIYYSPMLNTNNSFIDILSNTKLENIQKTSELNTTHFIQQSREQVIDNETNKDIENNRKNGSSSSLHRKHPKIFPFKKTGIYRLYFVASLFLSVYIGVSNSDPDYIASNIIFCLILSIIIYLVFVWIYNGFKK